MNSVEEYHIGVLSVYPIDVLEKRVGGDFHHGLLHVRIAGVHLFITHLTPFTAAERQSEAIAIAVLATTIVPPGSSLPVVLSKIPYPPCVFFNRLSFDCYGRSKHSFETRPYLS